jgi:predicted nucleic acid-binding protein
MKLSGWMGLGLPEVPLGTRIFVDSNIFLYVFFKHPVYGSACHDFIKRLEDNDLTGFVDEFVLNEVFHKLMITSVVNQCHCSPGQAIVILKKIPKIVQDMPQLWDPGRMLENIGVKIIPGPFFSDSLNITRQYNFLVTDAVHVAAMKRENLVDLATNDADFNRAYHVRLWKPE